MTKKKKTKSNNEQSFKYSVELNGLLLILIGLIGFGTFGPVGRIIKYFAIFLMGNWYAIFLGLLFILGIFMVSKRKLPKFFSPRLVGLYILVLSLLIFSHTGYIKQEGLNGVSIIKATIDNLGSALSTNTINIGGGVIGAAFCYGFYYLFAETGTNIILGVLVIFGVVMLFNISLSDMFSSFVRLLKKIGSLFRKNKKSIDSDSENEEKDNRIIVTSIDDLTNKNKVLDSIKTNTSVEQELNEMLTTETPKNHYQLPPITILDPLVEKTKTNHNEFIKTNQIIIEKVFSDFGIKGKVVEAHIGPSVTQFEIKIESGTKVNRVVSIKDELKLALAVKEIRIQAPIPGKSTIGLEMPNPNIRAVKLREIMESIPDNMKKANLLMSLGIDIMGRTQVADLTRMPHLLVAGSTGSGKSVFINDVIASLLMRYNPSEVKLVLVDPKKVELSNYNGIPHLLCPVVTDPKKASNALQKIVSEMEKRYALFSDVGAKNIITYNEYVYKQERKGNSSINKLPYIVVIIDELADLMLIAAKEVEDSIMRITQMARAAGIHLIVATQRPSTDVITGIVKANIPTRISFAVSSNIDSRTILDMSGAEKLLGKGDMLYKPMDEPAPIRIQSAYISDAEIKRLIDFVSKGQETHYDESLTTPISDNKYANVKEEYDDPLYNEIVEFAVQSGKISASLIQRRFRLGYNRAARIVDLLEERGIIGPQNGSKPREVLVKLETKE